MSQELFAAAQSGDVALEPGAPLRMRCRMSGGIGAAVVRSPRGIRIFDRELNGTWEQLVRVPPGTYKVEVTVANGAPQRRSLTVPIEGAELTFP